MCLGGIICYYKQVAAYGAITCYLLLNTLSLLPSLPKIKDKNVTGSAYVPDYIPAELNLQIAVYEAGLTSKCSPQQPTLHHSQTYDLRLTTYN